MCLCIYKNKLAFYKGEKTAKLVFDFMLEDYNEDVAAEIDSLAID